MSKKVTELPAATTPLAASDILLVVQGGASKQSPVSGLPSSGFTGGTLTSALNEAPIVTLASAATVDIGAAAANTISISGTTTITSLGTIASGALRRLHFQAALILTHNATSLILPTAANITTAAGDMAEFVSLGAGNWRCTGYERASGSALVGGGGGLTNWTEAVSTAAPNATIPVVSFTATNAAADVDAAFVPKGGGSVLASIPNNAASGGNKRGNFSVDLQLSRSSATEVASGLRSTIIGGQQCRASGELSIAGGSFAIASGIYSVALGRIPTASVANATAIGGDSPTASGQYAAAIGGLNLTSSGAGSGVFGGRNNTADGINSSISGGNDATTRGITGAEARGSGQFAVKGDAQRGRFVLRRATTDATASVISADGQAPAAATQIVLPNNSAYGFTGRLVARAATSADSSYWEFKGLIERGANAAATALVAAVSPTLIAQDAGAASWVVAVDADTTLGALRITVTGVAATNIRWVADVETVEVVG